MSAGGFAAYRPLLASTLTVTVGPDAATGDPLWHAAGREQIPTPRRRMTGADDGRMPGADDGRMPGADDGRMPGADDGRRWRVDDGRTLRHLDLATHRIANALDRCAGYS